MKLIVFILTFISVTACASTKQNNVIEQAGIINRDIQSADIKGVIRHKQLTYTEHFIINHAFNAYSAFSLYWGQYIKNPDGVSDEKKEELYKEYLNLKDRYAELEQVVINNWEHYNEDEKQQLRQLQAEVYKLNEAVEDAVRHFAIQEVIRNMMKVTRLVFKIGAEIIVR